MCFEVKFLVRAQVALSSVYSLGGVLGVRGGGGLDCGWALWASHVMKCLIRSKIEPGADSAEQIRMVTIKK